jgi:WXXGXW repeat (2 copies)
MKTKLRLLAVALIAGGTMFAQSQLSIGVGGGSFGTGAYPPPTYERYQPPCPGPGYSWVDGYWTLQGGRNVWSAGYWRQPVVTVAPRYVEPRYDHAYRGDDRDGHEHDRGHNSLSENRGSERHDNHSGNRGDSNSNGFRR